MSEPIIPFELTGADGPIPPCCHSRQTKIVGTGLVPMQLYRVSVPVGHRSEWYETGDALCRVQVPQDGVLWYMVGSTLMKSPCIGEIILPPDALFFVVNHSMVGTIFRYTIVEKESPSASLSRIG